MAPVSTRERHRRSTPCPICGGFDELVRGHGKRCQGYTTVDAKGQRWCRCSREDRAGNLKPEALDGGTVFAHCLAGRCPCGDEHGEPAAPYRPKPNELSSNEIETTYDYRDEQGRPLFQVCRMVGKSFRQRGHDGVHYTWTKNLVGVRRVLYRLPELIAAPRDAVVYVVEGEKDVESLRKLGHVATCNPQGAGKWHIIEACAAQHLAGRNVIVITDLDDERKGYVGQKHAHVAATHLRRFARSVIGPLECTKGHDISDHLAAGGRLDELAEMAWKPAPPPKLRSVPEPPDSDPPPAWTDEESSDPGESARPHIMLGHRVDLVVEALERHMAKLDPGLYQRAHELVTVLPSAKLSGVADGTPVIRGLSTPSILPRVTRHVQFVTAGKDGAPDVKTSPPDRILNVLSKSPPWPNVRPIVAVTESPIFRPDGSIRQDPGYDEATGYLYAPSCAYPPVPDLPTQQDAKDAYAELRDVFVDFPYADDASRDVPISAILSMLARPAIRGPIPMHLFDASVVGSGKTLQCDVCHLIASGRIPGHANWPVKDEDQDKLLSTYASAAPPGIVIDNVKGVLGGSALEQALTSDSVQFRQLGSNDSSSLKTLPWLIVVMASGNNVALTDDMIRRTLMCRLESSLEDPTSRTEFVHPELIEWVRAERPRLVVAALTMLRAYAAKGFPDAGTHLASYQGWARLVAGTIRFSGGHDATKAQPPRERAALDDSGAVATILVHLETVAEYPVTARTILDSCYPAPGRDEPPDGKGDLREAFEALVAARTPAGPSGPAIGKKLSKFNGRWFGNRRLVAKIDAHSKSLVFQIQRR